MAADVYLYLYNGSTIVQGSCLDSVFLNSIQLKTFSLEAEASVSTDLEDAKLLETRADMLEMPFSGEVAKAEKPLDSFSIDFTKEFDRSSTELFKNYALAATQATTYFTKGEVYCRIVGPPLQPGQKPAQICFLFYEFTNLYVYEYSLEVSGESSIPTETVKMYFDKYRITYRQQLSSGKLGTPLALGWDFQTPAAY